MHALRVCPGAKGGCSCQRECVERGGSGSKKEALAQCTLVVGSHSLCARLCTKPAVGLFHTSASIVSALNHDRCLAASHNAQESFIRCTERFSAKKALPDILSNGNATGEALAIESAEGTESESERLEGAMYSPH